jgi:hypothetical protein
MKKGYKKPALSAAGTLAQATALGVGRGISYFVCGIGTEWNSEDEACEKIGD